MKPSSLTLRAAQPSILMLVLAAVAVIVSITAVFLGKVSATTAALSAILAVSILAIRPRNEMLRLFKAAGVNGGKGIFAGLMGGIDELAGDPVRPNDCETYHKRRCAP